MNTNKYGKLSSTKQIPSSNKQTKKTVSKKTVNLPKGISDSLKINQFFGHQGKQVQRNQSSIVKKAENINIKFDSNESYKSKQSIRNMYKQKNLINLSHNKISGNKSINDSKQKILQNKSTINGNESLNKILFSANKKSKISKISKIPSSLGKKINNHLIPKSQNYNRQNNNKTQIKNININHNYNYNDSNYIINNSNNNLNNKKTSVYTNGKEAINNLLKNYYQIPPKKDNSFDIQSNSIKNKELKGPRFLYKTAKEEIMNNEESNIPHIPTKKKYFNNSINYNSSVKSDIQKRNKTVIGKKEVNSLINLNENKENLMLKNIILDNGKYNIEKNNNIFNSQINYNDNEETDNVIKKKINNIIERLELEKKKEKINRNKENEDDNIQNNNTNNKFNVLPNIKFKDNSDNSEHAFRMNNDEEESTKKNNINENNLELNLSPKETENQNDNNFHFDNPMSTYNKKLMKNGLYKGKYKSTKNNNIKIPEIIEPEKTERDEIQNIHSKFTILNPICKNPKTEIIKIDMKNIKNNYQIKKDINKKKDKESVLKLITQSLTGLVNLGETCYMNTGLQNIIHCIPFMKQFLSIINEFKDVLEQKIITNSFINLCISLIKNDNYNTKFNINSYDPTIFRNNFCRNHKEYADHEQHDSLEFLRIFLDDISKELNQTKIISQYKELTTEGKTKEQQNYEYNNFYLCRENSIIVKVFYSQIMNIFRCDCGDVSYSFEKILDIPLLFPKEITNKEVHLNDLLDLYFNGEKISWSLSCQKCGQKNLERDKKIKLTILPEVIIFSLQRFNPITCVKVNKVINFEEVIDLKSYCDNDFFNGEINTKYKLFGISNHSGTIDFGHYYSYTKVGDNWYEFNDSFVKLINLNLKSKAAYFFFYEKTE